MPPGASPAVDGSQPKADVAGRQGSGHDLENV
jgi:hypothetical protein